MSDALNADPRELEKFSELAARWWDREGPMAPLHGINPLRMGFIERKQDLRGQSVLDVGCGGGILAEAMAARGACVTAIDLSERAIEVARLHLHESGHAVDYRCCAVESLLPAEAQRYQRVTCMELLEHVPDPAAMVAACASLTEAGGELVFSTLNRNPKSFVHAILGAEYLLNLVPRGTHEYARFIRPSELARWCRAAGLDVIDTAGLGYQPLTRSYSLSEDVSVNYLMRCRRPQ